MEPTSSDELLRWQRADELFQQALELAPEQRPAFLERACDADAEVRRMVADLLAGHERVQPGFLESTGVHGLEGKRIGEFRLVRLLGEGGMGAVYEALQERPRRAVALKLVRGLPGLTRDARRLEYEAEIMARLQHPNVAQIYAAGTLEDASGQLAWFALELVEEARSLLEFCADRGLGLEERVDLFVVVCRAVQHGHQRGVIHRDLKPSNVLVDRAGAPKVIDFGIASAAGIERVPATLRVGTSELMGTLAYMSPEQARGEKADSPGDVYSLGVMLYELLVGRRPLELSSKSITDALAIVQHEPPRRPSALRPELRGDLETILLKALAKDPEERYATVSELAEDLQRWRRHEPIAATPPSLGRRLRLFTRRHRGLVASATFAALALATSTVLATNYAVRAAHAADSERTSREHAERVARFQREIFSSARPSAALGRPITVRELVDDAVSHAERELADDPPALCDVLLTLGGTYADLGELEAAERALRRALELASGAEDPARAASARSSLAHVAILRGHYEQAEPLLLEALVEFGSDSPSELESRIFVLYRYAELLRMTDRSAQGHAALDEALALCDRLPARKTDLRARVLEQLGSLAYTERDASKAEALHRQALAIREEILPADHPELATTRNSLANALFDQGKTDEAEVLWQAALVTFERVLDPDHPDLAAIVSNLALVYQRRRDFTRAEQMFARAIELRRRSLGDHPKLAGLLSRFSDLLVARGDLERAEDAALEAVEVHRRYLAREGRTAGDAGLAASLFTLALVERQGGRFSEAESTLREVLRIQRATLDPSHPDVAQTLTLLGSVLLSLERPLDAEPCLREALEIRRARIPENWLTANTESVLGDCLMRLGRSDEAEVLLRESLPRIEQALGREDYRSREARSRLAALYELTDRAELAAELAR